MLPVLEGITMKQRILHLSTLIKAGVCLEQVELFQELFGKSVIVTEKRAISVADKFDWSCGARRLLSKTAWDEYMRIRKPAWDEYGRIQKTAWDEYDRTQKNAYDEYMRIQKPTLVAYGRIIAKTFANLYINDKRN